MKQKGVLIRKKIRGKNEGLFASEDIKKGRVVAYYPLIVKRDTDDDFVQNRMYAFKLYDQDDNEHDTLNGDVDLARESMSFRNIPYWAHLGNEPDRSPIAESMLLL